MQGLGHFRRGAVRGAGIGHRQRQGDAGRREHDVAVALLEQGVQVERERGIVGSQRGHVRRGHLRVDLALQ